MLETIQDNLMKSFYNHKQISDKLKELEQDVISGKISPYIAARDLLEIYNSEK